jgi:putative nucleotidyltransferase with HDIG domain
MTRSLKTNAYIAVVVALGATALGEAIVHWHTASWVGFGIYLVVSMFASGFKLRLPGITGTVSAAFFPILIGIVCLSVPEALAAACISVLTQCVWNSKKRQWVKIVFNVYSVALAASSSAFLFHSQFLKNVGFEFALRLAILGLTYFVANTLPVCGVIAMTESKSVWQVWRGSCFWTFPHYLVGSAAAGLFELTRQHLGWQTALLFVPVSCLLYRACSLHIGRIADAGIHAKETAELYLRTITSLAAAIEAKDTETHDHLRRVQVYSMDIGKELHLNASELEALRAAALLHDIGKIAVPDHILGKPGKLTPAEFQKMKIHPVVGAEILERVRFPFQVAPIVRSHHEKWDGSGYPAGLKGEEIPIGARILSAVDCLDALASDRHYRRALPLHEAMAIVERDSGTAFDPRVVDVLKRRYIQLEQTARLDSSEPWHLSTDIYIERGGAPGAGFEDSGAKPHPRQAVPPGDDISPLVRLRCFVEAVNSGERFLSFDETLSILAARLSKVLPFDSMALYVPRRGALAAIYASGNHRDALLSLAIPAGRGVSGWVGAANRAILNGNPAAELCYAAAPCQTGALASVLALPLSGVLGLVGVLSLYSGMSDAFHSADLKVLEGIGPHLAGYLEKNSPEIGHPHGSAVPAEFIPAPIPAVSVLVH